MIPWHCFFPKKSPFPQTWLDEGTGLKLTVGSPMGGGGKETRPNVSWAGVTCFQARTVVLLERNSR